MDAKRIAELRLIQAAIAFHAAEIAYHKGMDRTSIYSVEDRLRGKVDFETERNEYIKRRIELTLACEQYAALFTSQPAQAQPLDDDGVCKCGHARGQHYTNDGACKIFPCQCMRFTAPAQAQE